MSDREVVPFLMQRGISEQDARDMADTCLTEYELSSVFTRVNSGDTATLLLEQYLGRPRNEDAGALAVIDGQTVTLQQWFEKEMTLDNPWYGESIAGPDAPRTFDFDVSEYYESLPTGSLDYMREQLTDPNRPNCVMLLSEHDGPAEHGLPNRPNQAERGIS